jgi:predicted DNA-binding transcriptional regulator AlpA
MAVAVGDKDTEQARKESLSAALSEAGPLVGHTLASQMLGLSRHARHAKQATFPKPVFRSAKGNPMWLRSDIEGYAAGRRDFTHAEGVLQDQYLDGHQLGAEVLGLASIGAVRQRVQAEAWEIVPRPAGKAGSHYYWSRADVERWLREKPQRLGPLSGRSKRSVL